MIAISDALSIKACYVPSFTLNLLSMSQLDSHGWIAVFGARSLIMYDANMIPQIAGQLSGGLYWTTGHRTNQMAIANAVTRSSLKDALQELDISSPDHLRKQQHRQNRKARKASIATPVHADHPMADKPAEHLVDKPLLSDVPFEAWHRRFAHANADAVRRILGQNSIVAKGKVEKKTSPCEVCIQGKSKDKPQRKVPVTRATKPFEMVHSDVAGPFPVRSHSKKLYFIIFVDDFTRYTFIYLLYGVSAEEICEKFDDLCNWLDARGWHILRLRSDSSVPHFLNSLFKSKRRARGIDSEPSPPNCQHKNGLAERMIQTILLKMRCVSFPQTEFTDYLRVCLELPLHFCTIFIYLGYHIGPFLFHNRLNGVHSNFLRIRKPFQPPAVRYRSPISHPASSGLLFVIIVSSLLPHVVVPQHPWCHLRRPFSLHSFAFFKHISARSSANTSTLQSMIDAGLPLKFWAEAAITAVHLHRVTPQQALGPGGWHSPHEMLFGKTPQVSHLRRFGCLVYIHLHEEDRTRREKKLGPRSEPAVMLGYVTRTTKLWRCWNHRLQKADNYSEVRFVEDKNGWTMPKDPIDDYDSLLPTSLSVTISPPPTVEVPPGLKEVDRIIQASKNRFACLQAVAALDPVEELRQRMQVLQVSGVSEDPATYDEAINSPDADKWKDAMKEEFASLLDNKTFDLEGPGSNANSNDVSKKAISCRWVFRRKHNPDGTIRFKARLVVRGFEQDKKKGETTYAPVAKLGTYRTLLAISASRRWKNVQLDVKTAFLNPEIEDDEIFIRLPPGVPAGYGPILRIKKALYGLRTSPIRWFQMLEAFLLSLGFIKSNFEETLYLMTGCICLVYVDDIQLWSTNSVDTSVCDSVVASLNARFAMTSLGRTQQFLGLEVAYSDDNSISVCQKAYIDATVARFPMDTVKPAYYPMDSNVQLFNGKVDDVPLSPRMVAEYLSLVGSLVWVSSSTRPDLAYATSTLASFNSKPLKMHWTAALRVLSYLKATKSLALHYKPDTDLRPLVAFSDSDWGSNVATRKSQSGYVLMMADSAIIWKSKPQRCVSLSSTEAEFYDASEAIRTITHSRALIEEISSMFVNTSDTEPASSSPKKLPPTLLRCDNAAAIKIYESGHFNERSKHIAVRVAHAFDETKAGTVRLEWTPSASNPADCLTKGLKRSAHEQQCKLIGLCPPAAATSPAAPGSSRGGLIEIDEED